MNPTKKVQTVCLLLWFIVAVALDGYANYLGVRAFSGWRLVSDIMMILGLLIVGATQGFKFDRYRKIPSTPKQWAFHIGLCMLVILGISIFCYQAYNSYYQPLIQKVNISDIDDS